MSLQRRYSGIGRIAAGLSKQVAVAAFVLSLLGVPWGTFAAGLPTASPEQVGLSKQRLDRIGAFLNEDIGKGKLPGAVVLIARHGKIAYWEAFGKRDPASPAAMGKDDIFRIASMTKPLVTVGVIMLAEEGKFALREPISKYIPQLTKFQVAVEKPDPTTGKPTVVMAPQEREITIQDLLRHTSGFAYGFNAPPRVRAQYEEADKEISADMYSNAELMDRLTKLPLAYQPGTEWQYGHSFEVLGRLIEVVSGKTLGAFLEERILKPLGMTDTAFYVPESKWGRVAEGGINPQTHMPVTRPAPKVPPKLESGGGGLLGTAGDYLRFCQMMLNGGELEGVRLLGPRTVAWMTSDQLGAIPHHVEIMNGPGYTWAIGFAVRETGGLSNYPGSPGEYTWLGIYGTSFHVDPKEDMIVISMVQVPLSTGLYYRAIVKTMAVDAILH